MKTYDIEERLNCLKIQINKYINYVKECLRLEVNS